jgi:hypothetical protein
MKKSSNDRRNFLLPVDARTGRPDSPELERQAIAAESIRDRLKELRAKVTLIVLDSCRDGPGGGKSGSKGLSRNGGANQLLVAYATEEDQTAEDGTGVNSTYAAALAQALKRPEPLLAQLDWVADEVTRRVPGQTPTRDGNLRHDARLVSPFAPSNSIGGNRADFSGASTNDPSSLADRIMQAAIAPCQVRNYIVRPGDTIIRIGLDHGINWRDIARVNGLDNPLLIEVGQILRVPCQPEDADTVIPKDPS